MNELKENNGYNSALRNRARTLRKNMTKEERHLWYDFLKPYPITIKRQRPIETYIVDFYCHSARLIIEVDGTQHFTTEGKEYDDIRSDVIEAYGLEVIRFSNYEINNMFYEVCTLIDRKIKERL